MRDAMRFLGLAGVVLLLFGLVSYGLTRDFDRWTQIHVTGGAILVAAAVIHNFAGFRRSVTQRGTRERALAVVGFALFAAILVTGNVLAVRHPWRHDATENQVHVLSGKTKAVVSGLARPLELLAFLPVADQGRPALKVLLDRFAALTPKLTWRFVDPVQEPDLASRFGVRQQGVLVAVLGDTNAQTVGDPTAGITEGAVTNLILKVTRPGTRAVYALTGHGEPSVTESRAPDGLAVLADALREENFEVRPLLLSAEPAVPADAAWLLIAGSRKPLQEHEVQQVRAYLRRGGRLLLLLDPGVETGLAELLEEYGIAAGDDMVVDQEQVPFLGARLGVDPIVDTFPEHPITRNFKERIVLLQARSVDWGGKATVAGAEGQVIAETGADSWAEKGHAEMLATGRVSRSSDDEDGPVPVAAAVRAPAADALPASGQTSAGQAPLESRVVVLGDSDLALNANLEAYFNREFLLNAAQWLSGNEELIAERPRGLRPSRLDMTQADFRTLFRLGVLLMPEALLIAGLGVWRRRRSL